MKPQISFWIFFSRNFCPNFHFTHRILQWKKTTFLVDVFFIRKSYRNPLHFVKIYCSPPLMNSQKMDMYWIVSCVVNAIIDANKNHSFVNSQYISRCSRKPINFLLFECNSLQYINVDYKFSTPSFLHTIILSVVGSGNFACLLVRGNNYSQLFM